RRRERIDLVHQMNPVFAGLSLGLIGCGLPILLGTFVARWPGGEASDAGRGRISTSASAVARWMITFVQQSFASVLLVTTPAALNRIATPALRKKALVLRHGVDVELFAPSTPADRTDEALSILFYAHLDRRKGVFVLVEAFREVLRQVPSCRLVLVGRGEHEAELRQVIAASGYADRVEIRDRVPRHEAPALLRQGSVYCLPSFGEPYGMTLLEAMACGCAVVVTDAGGPPHIVPPTGGLVVPTGNASALASALVELLQSPETRRRMGAVNRAHVESHHTWRAVVDRLEGIYLATVRSDEPAQENLPVSAA
ncbi:MAG: glycosyltransferase family 4 protein, partial [Janthinobacterium lividum]